MKGSVLARLSSKSASLSLSPTESGLVEHAMTMAPYDDKRVRSGMWHIACSSKPHSHSVFFLHTCNAFWNANDYLLLLFLCIYFFIFIKNKRRMKAAIKILDRLVGFVKRLRELVKINKTFGISLSLNIQENETVDIKEYSNFVII